MIDVFFLVFLFRAKPELEPVKAFVQAYFIEESVAVLNLKDLNYEYLPIRLTTEGPELEPLVIISTNKRKLGVTSTHGVTLANGHLIAAKDINVGDQLLTTDSSEQVLMVERPITDDLVFNLSVESDDPKSHLILAEGGLVVGDQFLQSSVYLNSTMLR